MWEIFLDYKKEINNNAIQHIGNLSSMKKENDAIKETIIKDIRNLYEKEKED